MYNYRQIDAIHIEFGEVHTLLTVCTNPYDR